MSPLSARLRNAILAGRRRPGVRGTGAPVRRRSDGYEFAELRAYVPGDDPRRIDWAATARAGGLQTRVVFEDHALTLAVALDASGSMFVGRSNDNYERGLEAARFWYEAALDEDRCARVTADGLIFVPSLRGGSAARLCAEHREPESAAFGRTLTVALAALPRDAQLLLVSDFFEIAALEPSLRACAVRFTTTALIVSDPWRELLPIGGFVRLRDAEDGSIYRAYVGSQERARYKAAVAARERHVVERLLECGLRASLLDEGGPADALFEAFGISVRTA